VLFFRHLKIHEEKFCMALSKKIKDIPKESVCFSKQMHPYFSDSYEFSSDKEQSIKEFYFGIFNYIPKWVNCMMKIRNAIAKPLGFSSHPDITMSPPMSDFTVGSEAGFLTIKYLNEREVVSWAQDEHMDLYISVMMLRKGTYRVSSLVNLKSRRAILYMKIIQPFHQIIAKLTIKNAIKRARI
jgi:hypothetical protein